jgi:cytochrome c oxidase cbb3-type subunit III
LIAMTDHGEIDKVSGKSTTGHQWDGIKELNTPLPRWWLWTFYATIIWSIGYWIVYPAWPLVSGYTRGVFNYSTRADVAVELANLEKIRGEKMVKLASTPLVDIEKDPALLALARARGKAAFGDNCAPCHGTGGAGSKGFPNLNDDEWIWGGNLDEIAQTIRHGVRSGEADARQGAAMPAFGRDGILKRADVENVADYVRSLAGAAPDPKADLTAGKKVFLDNCAVCHGETGKGQRELGAPNLSDAIWLYGADKPSIVDGIWNGRGGVMPAWAGRLDDVTIKALAVYVHSLGGGEK